MKVVLRFAKTAPEYLERVAEGLRAPDRKIITCERVVVTGSLVKFVNTAKSRKRQVDTCYPMDWLLRWDEVT